MNFLQETRLFSILSIALLTSILLGSFIFLNIIFSNFEGYHAEILYDKHKKILENIEKINSLKEIPLGGEPFLLGVGLVSILGEEEFYPNYVRTYWLKAKGKIKDLSFSQSLKPIKGKDLYFQVVLSPLRGRAFLSFYDATLLGYTEEKVQILSIFVFLTSILLPLYLYLFIKRAGKLYYNLVKEAKENPFFSINEQEPQTLIEALRRTNEELKILFERAKERASELEILSSTLSKNIVSGFILIDPLERVVEANSYALKVLQVKNYEEKINLDNFLRDYPKLLKNIKEAFQFKKALSRKIIEEREKFLGLTLIPLFKNSHFLGMILLFQDLTEIKRMEETIREKESLANLGTFSAGIAHEFRNSLSSIIGYGRLLKEKNLDEEGKRYLKTLLDEAKHINEVITKFLEFTKIQKIEKQEIEIRKIFQRTIEILKLSFPEINFILKGKDIKIDVDLNLFLQAIRAILENSAYAQKRGDVEISWWEEGNKIKIEIKDKGEGMDEETQKKAFIPFFSTKPEGTGLGLSLAHKIIILHDGSISIFSGKGKGTTFLIILNKEVLQNDTHKSIF